MQLKEAKIIIELSSCLVFDNGHQKRNMLASLPRKHDEFFVEKQKTSSGDVVKTHGLLKQPKSFVSCNKMTNSLLSTNFSYNHDLIACIILPFRSKVRSFAQYSHSRSVANKIH